MLKAYNIGNIFILLHFLYIMCVTCTNETQPNDKDSVIQRTQLVNKNNKVFLNKNRILNKRNNVTKGILRMGNQGRVVTFPRAQKQRLKNKGYAGVPRLTKMYMMQMDETTTHTNPGEQSQTQNEEINELLSPYAIEKQMQRIGAKFNGVNVTTEVIGRTLEYNDIVLVKFAKKNKQSARFRADDDKYVDETNEKKIIFLVHGLSVMGMIWINCLIEEKSFGRLLSYYLAHLDKFDIFLIPMANPDGYGYTTNGIDWNKNLSPQNACPGVAIDRNFDVAWNVSRPMSSCSQNYPGPAPFSEPESKAVRDLMHQYSHKIVAYIHVHAATYDDTVFKGDAVLYPKGYTDVQSDDDKYIDIKGELDETMRKANFQVYSVTVDTVHNWYGKVTGTSVDYASTVYGIPYAMEFVMQAYDEPHNVASNEKLAYHVTVEVWQRVIDVIVNNIWKALQSNEA